MYQSYGLGKQVVINGGRIIADTVEAGAVKSHTLQGDKLEADFATIQTIQSSNYQPGAAGVAPIGFKISGVPFTTTYKDGTTDTTCQFELGGDGSVAGYSLSDLVSAFGTSRSVVFDTPGTYEWSVPPGITSLYVEGCAAGGGGALGVYFEDPNDLVWKGIAGGGGGGGASFRRWISVIPGEVLQIVIPSGGLAGALDPYNPEDLSLIGGGFGEYLYIYRTYPTSVVLIAASGGTGGMGVMPWGDYGKGGDGGTYVADAHCSNSLSFGSGGGSNNPASNAGFGTTQFGAQIEFAFGGGGGGAGGGIYFTPADQYLGSFGGNAASYYLGGRVGDNAENKMNGGGGASAFGDGGSLNASGFSDVVPGPGGGGAGGGATLSTPLSGQPGGPGFLKIRW